jgi:hypothetical protein
MGLVLQVLSGWGWLVGFFAAGIILYVRHTASDGRIALLALIGPRSASRCANSSRCSGIRLLPGAWLALNPRLPVIPAARFGDLSYGLYIYGWPVEEAIMWLSGGRAAWWQVFLIALPAASVLALLSWHLVERPMLRLKPGSRRAAAVYTPVAQRA